MDKNKLLKRLILYIDIELLTKEEHYHAIRNITHTYAHTFNGSKTLLNAQNMLHINNSVRHFALGADHFTDRHCNRVFINARIKLTKTKYLDTNGRHIILCQNHTKYDHAIHNPVGGCDTKKLLYLATELDWTELCRHPQKYNYENLRTELDRAKYGFFRTTPLLPTYTRPKILQ